MKQGEILTGLKEKMPWMRADSLADAKPLRPSKLSPEEVQTMFQELSLSRVQISKYKRDLQDTEAELREYHDKYRQIYDDIPVSILTLDISGLILETNRACAKTLGQESGLLLGTSLVSQVSSDDQDVLSACLRQVIFTGQNQTCQVTLRPKNKKALTVKMDCSLTKSVRDQCGLVRIVMTEVGDQGKPEGIPEQQQLSQALQESEANFRLLTKLSPMPISYSSEKGVIEYVNDQFTRTFGYTLEDIPSVEAWVQKAFPDERYRLEAIARWVQALNRSSGQSKNSRSLEMRVTCKDGSIRVVEITGNRIGNKEMAVFKDITERKLAEERLQESEAKYRRLFETMTQGVIYQDSTGRITSANPAAERILGIPLEEMLGQNDLKPEWKAKHEDGREFLRESHPAIIALNTGNTNWAIMGFIHPQDSSYHWIIINAMPQFRPGETRPYQVYSTFDDVTEQKKAKEALYESEEHFRLLTKKSPLPITVSNARGDFEYVNDQFTASFGYRIEDIPDSQTWWQLAYPDELYRQKVIAEWKSYELEAARTNKDIKSHEFRLTCKDGTIRICEISSTLIGNKRLVVFNDITQRQEAESNLKHSYDKLQKALQATIDTVSKMVEMRDPYTAGHQQKVARLSMAIAQEMGLPEAQVRYIGTAAIVHDIGKIYVPAEILSRTGKLTDLEYQMMKTHVQGSYDILKNIDFPWPIADIILQHHERLDGSGYPNQLKDNNILLEARILAVADTVEAMSTHRPYRAALGIDEALEEISRNESLLYDAAVVKACRTLFIEKGFTF